MKALRAQARLCGRPARAPSGANPPLQANSGQRLSLYGIMDACRIPKRPRNSRKPAIDGIQPKLCDNPNGAVFVKTGAANSPFRLTEGAAGGETVSRRSVRAGPEENQLGAFPA